MMEGPCLLRPVDSVTWFGNVHGSYNLTYNVFSAHREPWDLWKTSYSPFWLQYVVFSSCCRCENWDVLTCYSNKGPWNKIVLKATIAFKTSVQLWLNFVYTPLFIHCGTKEACTTSPVVSFHKGTDQIQHCDCFMSLQTMVDDRYERWLI